MAARVVIARTGVANVASVVAALQRAGARPSISDDPSEIARAHRVVLPGVGAFGAAMAHLLATGLDRALARRVTEGRPLLAICLGMQLLGDGSEESTGVPGLGVVRGQARRFPAGVKVPQLGWNRVAPEADDCLVAAGFAYFANSFRLTSVPAGWRGAWSEHGSPFVAAIERGPVLACQFHPELSGAWGLDLIVRWLAMEGAC